MAQLVVKAPLHRLDQIAPGTRYRLQLRRMEFLSVGFSGADGVDNHFPRLRVIRSKPIRHRQPVRELQPSKFVPLEEAQKPGIAAQNLQHVFGRLLRQRRVEASRVHANLDG